MSKASMAKQPGPGTAPQGRLGPGAGAPNRLPAASLTSLRPADAALAALQLTAEASAPVQAMLQLQKMGNAAAASATIQRTAASGVIQRAYDDALRRESAHAVRTRLTRAITAFGGAASKEIRWREAQKPGSPLSDRAEEFQAAMQQNRDTFDREFQVLRRWFDSQGDGALTKAVLSSKSLEDIAGGNAFYDRLIAGAMAGYKAEADKQFERGKGQDELLLGYRSEVARDGNPAAKILDTNIWSWGVNQAWIEGGASKKANFTLDTAIGATALGYLAYMSGEKFLEAIKPENWPQGVANTLWHNRNARPTWYALELSGLLDMGYRPNDAETQLVPPAGPTKAITGQVQDTGVGAYIAEEN